MKIAQQIKAFLNIVYFLIRQFGLRPSLDNSFGFIGVPGPEGPLQPLGIAYDLTIEPSGKILVGTQNGIQRLNADGTKDATFTNSLYEPNRTVTSVELLSDGKILASGGFTSPTNRIAKLNSDGTLDQTFAPPSSLNSTVWKILAQSDGKIMIGGFFTGAIMRLNADGSQDHTLEIPSISGGQSNVRDIQILPSGYYMVSGNFSSPRTNIAILCEGGPTLTISNFSCGNNGCGAPSGTTVSYTSDATFLSDNIFTVELSDASGSFTNPTIVGTIGSSASSGTIPISFQSDLAYGGGYRLRIVSSSPAITGADNGTNLQLGVPQPNLSVVSSVPVGECGATITFSVDADGFVYDRYSWIEPFQGFYYTTTDPDSSSITVSTNGTYIFVGITDGFNVTITTPISIIFPCCTAPTAAGVIAGTQLICPNTAATTLTSTAAASSDGVGTLEYRWQQSTTGPNSGFSDIANSDSDSYSPGVLSTTTWFRRLGGVSCLTDWSNAPSSNVVQVTVEDIIPPTVSCLPFGVIFNGQEDINLNVNDFASASDNCGVQSLVSSIPAISCTELGQILPVTVTATDNSGNTASCVSMITVQGLPCGWRQLPNGVNCANGNLVSYNTANQVFTVNSTNCHTPMAPHVADGFAFAQRTLCGNGSIEALVTSVNGLGWAGISMRESNAAGAKKVHLLTNRQFYHRREVRSASNGQALPQTWLGFDRYWLRLVRTGTNIVGFISPNGTQWVQVLVAKVSMNSCIEMGLLTHHSNTTGNMTATFSNVTVTGTTNYYLQQTNTPENTGSEQVAINPGSIFPNPSSGEVFIDLADYRVEEMQLEVYDQLGRQLRSMQLAPMDTPWQQLDLSDLPAGMYFVKLNAQGYPQQTERVIIQRP